MADPRHAWADNVGGRAVVADSSAAFYVDRECILCEVCAAEAPANFALSSSEDHDVCYRQPRSVAELEACYAAMAACPVEAIGDDGILK